MDINFYILILLILILVIFQIVCFLLWSVYIASFVTHYFIIPGVITCPHISAVNAFVFELTLDEM